MSVKTWFLVGTLALAPSGCGMPGGGDALSVRASPSAQGSPEPTWNGDGTTYLLDSDDDMPHGPPPKRVTVRYLDPLKGEWLVDRNVSSDWGRSFPEVYLGHFEFEVTSDSHREVSCRIEVDLPGGSGSAKETGGRGSCHVTYRP
jgi:hypothetical protein